MKCCSNNVIVKSESFRVETISPLRTWNASFLLKNFKELLVLLLLIQTSLVVFAQESNKKRVVVVPCSRFEFTSEFELSEIAQKNEVTVSEIFLIYQKKMLNTFEEYSDENFEFVPIKYALIKPYKKALKTQIGKFNGKRYNQANLAGISETEFTQLLEAHQADFMCLLHGMTFKKNHILKMVELAKECLTQGIILITMY